MSPTAIWPSPKLWDVPAVGLTCKLWCFSWHLVVPYVSMQFPKHILSNFSGSKRPTSKSVMCLASRQIYALVPIHESLLLCSRLKLQLKIPLLSPLSHFFLKIFHRAWTQTQALSFIIKSCLSPGGGGGGTQLWVGYRCAARSFDHHPITKPEKTQICNL